MAEQIIDVDGELIAFPADMSDAQIAAIIKNQSAKPRSSFAMGLGEPILGAEQLAGKAAQGIASLGGLYPNQFSESLGQTNEQLRLRQLADEEALMASRASQGQEGMDWSRLLGNVLSPANLVGGVGAAKTAVSLGAKSPALVATAGGVGSAATMPVTGEDYALEKAEQLGTGAALGALGQKGIEFGSRALNPLVSAAEKRIRDLGVTPTIGQTLGGIVQSTEEFISSLPGVGKFVKNAQEDSYDQFRLGVLNKGLAKVDSKLPKGTSGYDAIQQAFKIKDVKYDEALKGTSFLYDDAAKARILKTKENITFDTTIEKETYDNILKSIVDSRLDSGKAISGQSFKDMESQLTAKIFQYRKGGVAEQQIADALSKTLDDIKSVFRRQNPEQSSQLRRVDSLYRDLTLVEDASKRSQTGKFTPENYNAAVKENAGGRRKRQFGRGASYNQDISSAGVEVLGRPEGDVLNRVLQGGVGIYGASVTDPTIMAVLGSAALTGYTKAGKKAMDALLVQRPDIVKQVGDLMNRTSRTTGGLFGPEILRQYNLEERKRDQ
jgi:hypothetical protein